MGIVFISDKMKTDRSFFSFPGNRFPQRIAIAAHDKQLFASQSFENAGFAIFQITCDGFLNYLIPFLRIVNFEKEIYGIELFGIEFSKNGILLNIIDQPTNSKSRLSNAARNSLIFLEEMFCI
jgi:hypothetical protein